MLNRTVIMGRFTADPELRRTQSGTAVASFTLAVERDFKGQNGDWETDFIDLVAWSGTAELVAKYFTKGRMAVAEGRIQTRSWTDKHDQKRKSTEIVVENIYFVAARPIEEGRTMTQKENTVTIHGNRMWRRMQEEAARRKRRGRIIQGVHCLLTAALAIALLCVCLGAKEPGQLPEPVAEQQNTVVTLNTISPSPLPDTTTGQLASDLAEEAEYIAKALYGEARGCSTTEQAAVVWCILNRVDDESGLWPDDIIGVVTQEHQFIGYSPEHPVLPELYDLAMDVLERWQLEKGRETDVGRVLPADYCYFQGDGQHNYFRREFEGGPDWDWRLETPYER